MPDPATDGATPCRCPCCNMDYADRVAPAEREGPRHGGRLLRVCTCCAVTQVCRTKRKETDRV